MLRLSALLLFIVAGCEAEFTTGPSDDERMATLTSNLVAELVGPNADATPLDCPDLEGDTPGRYACTSTVDGQDVTWDMTVVGHTTAAGTDSTSVRLVPDYGSKVANVERAVLRSFRQDHGVVLTSVSCPPSQTEPYAAVCRGVFGDAAFDIRYEDRADGQFVYEPVGVGIRAKAERALAGAVENRTGLAADVTCEIADAWLLEPGQTIACDAQARESDNQASIEATITDREGNFVWEVLSTSNGS